MMNKSKSNMSSENKIEEDINENKISTNIKMVNNTDIKEFNETINLKQVEKFMTLTLDTYITKFKDASSNYTEDETRIYFYTIRKYFNQLLKNNTATVKKTYKYGKNQNNGRLYVNGFGIQSLEKSIKKFVLDGVNVQDYDIINCHPTILLYLCNQLDIKTKYLNEYIINRDEMLEKYNFKKLDINILLNCDKYFTNNIFLNNLFNEVNPLKQIIVKNYEHLINSVDTDSKNKISSKLNRILCYFENNILQSVIEHYKEHIHTIFYDGFTCDKDIDINILNELTEEYGVKWAIKSLKNDITIDTNITLSNFDTKDLTTYNISKRFYDLFNNKFIYYNNNWYCYNGNYWEYEEQNITMIRYYSTKFADYFFKLIQNNNLKFSNNIKENEREKIQKENNEIHKIIKWIRTEKKIQNYIKHSIIHFTKSNDFKFNDFSHIIQHRNCVYNLKTHRIEPSNPLYYTSQTTNLTIEGENDKLCVELLDIIDNIFYDNPSNRDIYLTVLSTGLYGKILEKFTLANGAGRNGKGLLNELMEYMLNTDRITGYCHRGKPVMFQNESKNGPDQELANLSYKRLVLVNEPECNKKYNCSKIKEITGNSSINGRGLYCKNDRVELRLTLICETNHRIAFDSVDNGIQERLIEIPFKSTFSEVKENDLENLIFKQNKYYKSDEFKKIYAESLFWILTKYYKSYCDNNNVIKLNDEVRKLNKKYMIMSDLFTFWLDNNFKYTGNKKDIIKLKDIFETYKDSEYYNILSNKCKRTHNKGWVKDKLKEHILYKKHFKSVIKINKKQLRSVLVGYIIYDKNEEDFDEDDEEM